MEDYLKHKFRSRNPWVIIGLVLLIAAAVTGLAILFGFIVMWLWNWLAPDVFGLPEIGYWQAVGIFILFKILFGGFGGGGNHKQKKKKKKDHREEACEDSSDEFGRWKFYGKFWEEEGEKAFTEYVERKKKGDVQPGSEEEQ